MEVKKEVYFLAGYSVGAIPLVGWVFLVEQELLTLLKQSTLLAIPVFLQNFSTSEKNQSVF